MDLVLFATPPMPKLYFGGSRDSLFDTFFDSFLESVSEASLSQFWTYFGALLGSIRDHF